MAAIPPASIWKSNPRWRDQTSSSQYSNGDKRFALDQTLKLSHEYSEILNCAFPRFRSTRPRATCPEIVGRLDQSSELLILSSYLCIVEIYDKILHHFRACAEQRAKQESFEERNLAPCACHVSRSARLK